jgi:hypothetical protein
MKLIPLSQGLFAKVDDEDYDWIMQWKWYANKAKHTIYATRHESIKGRKGAKRGLIKMHRFILNNPTCENIDHADHDGLNNQKSNLRIANDRQNNANRKSQKGSSSKYLGVIHIKERGVWHARIRNNHKAILLGDYKQEDEAAEAYNIAAKKIHGEFANLNDIPENLIRLGKIIYNKPKYKGVRYDKIKDNYFVVLIINKKEKRMGTFKSEKEAALVYNKKVIELYGENAKLNIIE